MRPHTTPMEMSSIYNEIGKNTIGESRDVREMENYQNATGTQNLPWAASTVMYDIRILAQ